MKKKVIYFVSFITICLLCVSVFSKGEVKAEETCTTHYNYYLLQDSSRIDTITGEGHTSSSKTYNTSKVFALGMPSDAVIISEGKVNIVDSSELNLNKNTMSTGYFYNLTTTTMKNKAEARTISLTIPDVTIDKNENFKSFIYCDNKNNCFTTSSKWVTEDDNIETSAKKVPSTYDAWHKVLARSSYDSSSDETNITYTPGEADGEKFLYMHVSRYWSSSTLQELVNNGAKNDTTIYTIAAYYVEYKVCEEEDEVPVTPEEKSNKVTIHYYIDGTTTKLHDDFVENNVAVGKYTKSCPETLEKNSKYYDRINSSVSVEMEEDNEEELICYYKEQTYSVTVNYGEDEDCTKLVQDSHYSDGHKAGDSMTLDVPESIDNLSEPTLGTYSSQIVNKPSLDGTTIKFTMPAKDVSICVVYTPQTGSSIVKWIALIGLAALAFTVWNISKKNNEINEEV